jgi:hypothetical protein
LPRQLAALLTEAGKDPAMLVWLDQAQSRKEHPNENFAREVMELFALGEGHYTEHDITEAARALTGWSLDRDGSSSFPPGVSRQRRQNFSRPHGKSQRRGRHGANRRAAAGGAVHHGQALEFFRGPDAVAGIEQRAGGVFARTEIISSRSCASCSAARNFTAIGHPQPGEKPVQWLVGSVRCWNAICRRRW